MKTGDADVVVWLEGRQGRSYAVVVTSWRRGPKARVIYRWQVERWAGEEQVGQSRLKVERTFKEAMRRGWRCADVMERA